MIRTTTLPNGARIVTEVVDSVYSAAIDLWIEVGSAYENPENSGVSHCIEHMLFKGTKNRTSERLMEEIEDVGGMLSASTSRELTKLYGHVLGESLPVAVDIILDMAKSPLMAAEDLELERKVILDEIEMYEDDPGDVAQELVYSRMWEGSPQAMPITGDARAVKKISVEMLQEHFQKYFRPERMIVSVAGSFDEDATIAALSQGLGSLEGSASKAYERPTVPEVKAFKELIDWDTEMAQLIMAMPGLSTLHRLQPALLVLDLCLTTSASSRLFKEVREKRGLAYNIGSLQHSYRDSGLYGVAAAVSPAKAEAVFELVLAELALLKKEGLSEREILRAKSQLRTDLLMDKESMSARSTGNAADLLLYDRIIDLAERQAEIEGVTNDQIVEVANLVFVEDPSLVLVGPESQLKRLLGVGNNGGGAMKKKNHKGRVKKPALN